MKQLSSTRITLSIDTSLKKDLDQVAAEEVRTASDLFQEMYNYYMFKRSLRRIQEQAAPTALRLGLETDDDVYRYLSKVREGQWYPACT